MYDMPTGKMAQGAGHLADKATRESSSLAEAMLQQTVDTATGSTTTTLAPTTTMSVAEYNAKQEQLEADKARVLSYHFCFRLWHGVLFQICHSVYIAYLAYNLT